MYLFFETKLICSVITAFSLLIVSLGRDSHGVEAVLNATGCAGPWPSPEARDQFFDTKGLGDSYDSVRFKLAQLRQLIAMKHGLKVQFDNCSVAIDDMVLNEAQLDYRLRQYSARTRRQIVDMSAHPNFKWILPIQYMFDGTQNAAQKATIRAAVAEWQQKTCITFSEQTSTPAGDYILFTSNSTGISGGCWSYVGCQRNGMQRINLEPSCLTNGPGIAMHEIGHAIGFDHEQCRTDRDNYITIYQSNIISQDIPNFEIDSLTTYHGLTYDYSSIMQYAPKSFSKNGDYTMVAQNSLFTSSMGQQSQVSFYDAYLVNKQYCPGVCSSSTLSCQNGGYPDPDQTCSVCRCPDGFGGNLCQNVAASDPSCPSGSQTFSINASTPEQCVTSPNYGSAYPLNISCSWQVAAPFGFAIYFVFRGSMNVLQTGDTCQHWVEIKYRKDLQMPGARFCQNGGVGPPSLPGGKLTSESSTAVIIFDTKYSGSTNGNSLIGFKLCFAIGEPIPTTLSTTTIIIIVVAVVLGACAIIVIIVVIVKMSPATAAAAAAKAAASTSQPTWLRGPRQSQPQFSQPNGTRNMPALQPQQLDKPGPGYPSAALFPPGAVGNMMSHPVFGSTPAVAGTVGVRVPYEVTASSASLVSSSHSVYGSGEVLVDPTVAYRQHIKYVYNPNMAGVYGPTSSGVHVHGGMYGSEQRMYW